jgi:hypothetical protein
MILKKNMAVYCVLGRQNEDSWKLDDASVPVSCDLDVDLLLSI